METTNAPSTPIRMDGRDVSLRSNGSLLLKTLPRIVDGCDSIQFQTSIPSPLALDTILSTSRVNAMREAREQYVIEFDSRGKAPILADASVGTSECQIVSIALRHASYSAKKHTLVAKVMSLERMPDDVSSAYSALLEMIGSVFRTKTADMVFLESVEKSASVLMCKAKGCMKACDIPIALFRGSCECAQQTLDATQFRVMNRGDTEDNYTTGEMFFDMEHIVAAIRLWILLENVPVPHRYRDNPDKWTEDRKRVFEPFTSAASRIGMTAENAMSSRPPRAPRAFVNKTNDDKTNEVVAGMRATLLYRSGIAASLTPIYDYFEIPILGGRATALYVVMPEHNFSLRDFIAREESSVMGLPTQSGILMMRSLLAQVLHTLEAIQHHLRCVLYDLHVGNIMVDRVVSGMPERVGSATTMWRYVRPDGKEMVIPACESNGHAARIIDYGRARVDDPCAPGNDDRASFVDIYECAPSARFDTQVDMRALAHDLVTLVLRSWIPDLLCAQEPTLLRQFSDVLEAMTGYSNWNGWCKYNSSSYMTLCGKQIETKPPTFMDYAYIYWDDNLSNSSYYAIRENEFVAERPVTEPTHTPTDILNMPFFSEYHQHTEVDTVLVADATKTLQMSRSPVDMGGTHPLPHGSPPSHTFEKKRGVSTQ